MNDDIYAMLLTHDKVKQFTNKPIADAHKTLEVLTALAVESKTKVNELADRAIKAGWTEAYSPKDYGFMFARSFEDPDGHIWEVFWMDPNRVQIALTRHHRSTDDVLNHKEAIMMAILI
ncbi:MAG: hypothetical protein U0223_21495 [Nitrospira sp.]